MYKATIKWKHGDEPTTFIVDEHNYVGAWVVFVFPDGTTDAYPERLVTSVSTESTRVRAV